MTNDLDLLDLNFGDEGDLVKPTLKNNPHLQWFNGLPTTTLETAVGFHIEAEVHPGLDEILEAMGTKRYIVQHKSLTEKGEPKQIPYWALNWGPKPCSLFILSYGLKSKYEMNKNVSDRCGIVYGWQTMKDRAGNVILKEGSTDPKRLCRVQFRVYVHELVQQGFLEWFQVSFSGYNTDEILGVLGEQFRVLDAYNAYARTKGYKHAPFHGFSLPIFAGPMKMAGRSKSSIYPPLAQIPEKITGAYLVEHRIPEVLKQQISDNDELTHALAWSVERSIEIESGTTDGTEAGADAETVQNATVKQEETVPEREEDRVVNEAELAWITNAYCVGNTMFLTTVCQRFAVASAQELLLSHYKTLQAEAASYTA